MPWQPPAEERRRSLLWARRLLWIALGCFGLVAVSGIVVLTLEPRTWWLWAIAFVLVGFVVARRLRLLRAVNRALPLVEAELNHQPHTSSRAHPDR